MNYLVFQINGPYLLPQIKWKLKKFIIQRLNDNPSVDPQMNLMNSFFFLKCTTLFSSVCFFIPKGNGQLNNEKSRHFFIVVVLEEFSMKQADNILCIILIFFFLFYCLSKNRNLKWKFRHRNQHTHQQSKVFRITSQHYSFVLMQLNSYQYEAFCSIQDIGNVCKLFLFFFSFSYC